MLWCKFLQLNFPQFRKNIQANKLAILHVAAQFDCWLVYLFNPIFQILFKHLIWLSWQYALLKFTLRLSQLLKPFFLRLDILLFIFATSPDLHHPTTILTLKNRTLTRSAASFF